MRPWLIAAAICLSLTSALHASHIRARGMAMQGVALQDEAALFANPAAPGDSNRCILQASMEDRYGIGLLRSRMLACAAAFGNQRLGIELTQTGASPFSRNAVRLTFGRSIFQKARIGLAISGASEVVRANESTYRSLSWTSAIGWWIQALPKTRIGITMDQAESLLRKASTQQEQACLKFGIAWSPVRPVQWIVEASQRFGQPALLATGIHYQLAETIGVACGWRSDRMLLSLGLSIRMQRVRMDLSFEQHRQLGPRSSAGLLYHFGRSR